MARTEPTPSTRRAATRDQPDSGTGQRVGGATAPGKVTALERTDDRPSKSATYPSTSKDYDGKDSRSQSQSTSDSQRTTTAPEPEMPSFVMYRDSGPKTAREREFASWNSANRAPLDGSNERAFFPSPLERGEQAEIAKGDKYAGTANKVAKPKNQAQ